MRTLKPETERLATSKQRRCTATSMPINRNAASTDLTAALDAVLSLVAPRARLRRVRMDCETTEHVHLNAEPLALIAIIDGLLTNAIVRSPSGGQVTCRISARAGDANIEVSDQGPALRTRDLDRLLWPQAISILDEPRSQGLLDSRWTGLVKAFDGSRIEGRSTSNGASFKLSLPIAGCP